MILSAVLVSPSPESSFSLATQASDSSRPWPGSGFAWDDDRGRRAGLNVGRCAWRGWLADGTVAAAALLLQLAAPFPAPRRRAQEMRDRPEEDIREETR